MHWLKDRLTEINKTGMGLARALALPPARVYEMQAGKRRLQPHEIRPAAQYLEWSEAELLTHLTRPNGGRLPNGPDGHPGMQKRVAAKLTVPLQSEMLLDIPVLGKVGGQGAGGWPSMPDGEPIDWVRRPPRLQKRTDVFALYVENVAMSPRYEPGSLILLEQARPPQIGDDVVVEVIEEKGKRPLLARLIAATPALFTLTQFNPPITFDLARKSCGALYRVMTMMDLLGS